MNWQNLISDLQGFGLTQVEIALQCNSRQSTISELARGKLRDPKHRLGEALKQLHEQCHRKAKAAERRRKVA